MAEKKVTVIVGQDGEMTMSFDGFEGNSCYDEAKQIQAQLKLFGIEVDCISLIPKESVKHGQIGGIKNEQSH